MTFTEIASLSTPNDIVDMLNALYTRFDKLTEMNQVYKVRRYSLLQWERGWRKGNGQEGMGKREWGKRNEEKGMGERVFKRES